MGSARTLDTQSDPLHLIFAVELHFLEFYFFEKVFRTEVGGAEDFPEFRFVELVLFEQTPIVSVCIEEYVPRAALQGCHAFLLNQWPRRIVAILKLSTAETVMQVRGLCDGTLTQGKERSRGYLWEVGPSPRGPLVGQPEKHGNGGFDRIEVVVWTAARLRKAVLLVEGERSFVGFADFKKNRFEQL